MNNTITAPKGFLASGIVCGLKRSGKKDLGLLVCPTGAVAAGVFTTNKIYSAAVAVCKKNIRSAIIDGVVVNSGNANACTGLQGIKDANAMCQALADQIETSPKKILVASTGIIGHILPVKKVITGVARSIKCLASNHDAGLDFATAIMTTDTRPKQAFKQIKFGKTLVSIAGAVKGAGMIGPNMATTLCFITTDAAITKPLLARALSQAVGSSLNRLTVDGHQSTNDTALVLASGLAGNKKIAATGKDFSTFALALKDLCTDLAKQMALDAEGATRMFTVRVTGAASKEDAAKASRAVADYPLFKCAVHGSDPNWGRIICAVGSSQVKLKSEKVSCKLDNIVVFKNGRPTDFNPKKASKVMSQKEFTITIDLGVGKYSDFCYGCDLSREYIAINADYHT
ncbi:MAG: bifunctional ornithine acetyltransferase/N-acetylglutamate synthase [Planctomycetes bacterium GWF2_50_10]|nr:MAG: bifunctional ornithine acetyltransferase/N-acetylglutamate synthase [Planctomycetes bacterium GWF2_50_10]